MSEPEYLVCLVCDSPAYTFDWNDDKLVACVCITCGNDEVSEFMTESELEEQQG